MQIDRSIVRKILVIKLRAIGDVLLSTIVTKNLRQAFPEGEIDFLTELPSRDVVRGNPYLNTTLVYDKVNMSGLELIRLIRTRSYDLVIDLFGNPRTALVTRVSGARYRVGFDFRWRRYAYNIVAQPRGAHVHNTQFNLDALAAIGVDIQDRNLYFPLASEDLAYVDEFLARAGLTQQFLVGVSAGGGWYTKRWGLDKYAELCDRLIKRYKATVILTWGPGQRQEVETIRSKMTGEPFVPPATTLRQLGALLQRCSITISNDSGPMHIAAAVGVPVLGIFGPTNPVLQGPYGSKHITVSKSDLDCLGCNLTKCPIGHPCMLELSVDEVMGGVERLLAKNGLFS
jgi:heptosyltransferase-3